MTLMYVPLQVPRHLPRIRSELLKQLISLHQVDKALEALALLIDFLILSAIEQFFLDAFKQWIPLHHQVVVRASFVVMVFTILLIALFDSEQPIDQLFKRALVVLGVLLVILGGEAIQIYLQSIQDVLEAN